MLIVTSKSFFTIGGFLMFKIERFRKSVMKYNEIFSNKPEIIKENTNYYLTDLKNLIKKIDLQLDDISIILEKCCNFEKDLSAKPENVFWNYIQRIVDWFYDNLLYSMETLDGYKRNFERFKFRVEQIKLFHNKL